MITFRIEKRLLETGLLKLREVWADVEVNPALKYVLFTVKERELVLCASNLYSTAEVILPLYEPATVLGKFGLVGKAILDTTKACDDLVSVSVLDNLIVTVETKGYKWEMRGISEFPLGSGFTDLPGVPAVQVEMPREQLLKSLRVLKPCVSTDASVQKMYGIHVGPESSEATDGTKIGVYRVPAVGINFTVPTPSIGTLEVMLHYSTVEKCSIRYNHTQVEVVVGQDKLVFGQMGGFVEIPKIVRALNDYRPIFEVDKASFVVGLKRSGLLGDAHTTITISRQSSALSFIARKGAQVIGEGLIQVAWAIAEPDFSIILDWKVFAGVISSLDTEVIKFGVGSYLSGAFVRLDEPDKSLFVVSKNN